MILGKDVCVPLSWGNNHYVTEKQSAKNALTNSHNVNQHSIARSWWKDNTNS